MALPFFYKQDIDATAANIALDEDTARHVVQVLRMQMGEQLQLTDGKGNDFITEITAHNKKNCTVKILSSTFKPASPKKISIAISLVKNAHRFEWFLEKAAEIGITEIVPLLCTRTEKQHFRMERMNSILISAMLQSQQSWLPLLHEPTRYTEYIKGLRGDLTIKKFIAHCESGEPRIQLSTCRPFHSSIVLIGPEGDFTIDEIDLALQNDFAPVALGDTRLRTETAGVVSVTILSLE